MLGGSVEDDVALGLALLQGFAHFFDTGLGDSLILTAIEAENGDFERGGEVDGVTGLQGGGLAFHPTVPGGTSSNFRIVDGIKPDDPASPAETGDGSLLAVALVLVGVREGGVNVGHYLRIGHFAHDVAHECLHVFDVGGVALPSE